MRRQPQRRSMPPSRSSCRPLPIRACARSRRRVADLLRAGAVDRRGHRPRDPTAPGRGSRRFRLRQEFPGPRRRSGPARAGARQQRRALAHLPHAAARSAAAESRESARRAARAPAPTLIASARSAAPQPGGDAPAALAELLRRGDDDHVCILIDQFEELFSFARKHGRDEAQLFVDILVGLQAKPPPGLYAILTMRSEFLGRLRALRGPRRGGQPDPVPPAADGAAGADARDPRAGDALRWRGEPRSSPTA